MRAGWDAVSARAGLFSLICEPNLLRLFVSVWEWLSSATVINICISIVLAWLNTNSSISGLAEQFPFCFKTNIHTYWCFSSSETRLERCLLSFGLMENITSIFVSTSYLFFMFALSLHFVSLILIWYWSFHHLVAVFNHCISCSSCRWGGSWDGNVRLSTTLVQTEMSEKRFDGSPCRLVQILLFLIGNIDEHWWAC